MTVLAVTDITLLSPDFGNAINNVHNILMPVAYVVVAGGLTWATIRAHAERSLNTVMVQLIRIALVALFLINIGLVGNFINGAVSSIEEQTGINGNPMAAFVAAIKQKFGIDLSVLTNATNAMFPGGSSVGSINTLPAGTTPTISTYGYEQPGDPTYDPQSAQGSGAFPFSSAPGSLMEGTSFAVSPSLSAGLTPGQTIQVNLTNGQSITGVYADKTADSYNGQTLYRVDIYDPNQQYSNLSGVGISSITPVSSPPNFAVATEGDTSVGFGAATQPPSNLGEFWNGMLHPMESIELGLLGINCPDYLFYRGDDPMVHGGGSIDTVLLRGSGRSSVRRFFGCSWMGQGGQSFYTVVFWHLLMATSVCGVWPGYAIPFGVGG